MLSCSVSSVAGVTSQMWGNDRGDIINFQNVKVQVSKGQK